MGAADSYRLDPRTRRRALRLGYVNGVLWSVGNGLTSGTLVYYLAMDLGARGIAISWILAAPAAAGLFRLFSPVLIHLCGDARRTCLWFSLASYLLLCGLPVVALRDVLSQSQALTTLIVLLCVHQLLEYIGLVAYWSWLADIVPRRIRGRYFGRRQIWNLLALAPTLLVSGYFADAWKEHFQTLRPGLTPLAYLIPAGVGTLILFASLIPLARMPATRQRAPRQRLAWRSIPTPFRDRRYWRLLLFGIWFSMANGLTQSAQNIYPYTLGMFVLSLSAMRTSMRVGQLGVAAWAGPFSDRYGNRPVLIFCQIIVATGPLFFVFTQAGHTWVLLGAWLAWSFYAGLNICLPNLMLKLSPEKDNSSYIATYFAVTNVVYAVSTVAGGYLTDYLQRTVPTIQFYGWQLNHFQYLLLNGWVHRTLAVLLLLRISEPGAWTWLNILRPSLLSLGRYVTKRALPQEET